MSEALLDQVIAAETALVAAIDGHDAGAIETALGGFRDSLIAVRGTGAWRDTAEVRDRLARALALAEAARMRVAYLADMTRRKLDRLASLGAAVPPAAAYGRNGRLR